MSTALSPSGPDSEFATFDANVVQAMGLAYEKAVRELHDRGQSNIAKEIIAKRIVAAAKTGMSDSERLCEIGLGRWLDGR